jgi:hypothetical protein
MSRIAVLSRGYRLVICSCCARSFGRGVTRVRRFVIFHFCAHCHRDNRPRCELIMDEVSK